MAAIFGLVDRARSNAAHAHTCISGDRQSGNYPNMQIIVLELLVPSFLGVFFGVNETSQFLSVSYFITLRACLSSNRL